MYSPPTGGAARRPTATIAKQHMSKRRFIISGEEDYLCEVRKSASGRARSPRAPSFRGRPGGSIPTSLHPFRRAPGLPAFAASGPGGPYLQACIHFAAHQVFPRLPRPDQRELIAANERFCRERTRIVVRCHHKSVRAGAHDCEQIAFMHFRHFPAERKKIPRLTHRSDNIDLANLPLPLSLRLLRRYNFEIALV